jgi:hypothetical protein
MQLDITDFFNNECAMDYSASVAEIGNNAGQDTWNAAIGNAPDYASWLDTESKRQEFRDYIKGFGAWEVEEIAGWTDDALTALLIQMISGDIREGELDTESPDWEAYQKACEAGQCSGRLYLGDDERVYYYIGD